MAKAYSYVRFSSKRQARGASFDRQLDKARAYCERERLNLDESMTMHDLGVSAFKGGNVTSGALGLFLKGIEDGKVKVGDTLIVESFDRLSRQKPLDALKMITGILEAGVTIVTLMDGQRYTEESVNGAQMFVLQGILMRAHEESKTKSERVKDAQQRGKEKAREDGKAWHGRPPTWIKKEGGEFRIDKAKGAVVKRAIKLSLDGLAPPSIAIKFNQEGVETFTNRAKNGWHYSVIKTILRNRALIGEYQPTRTETSVKRVKGRKVETSKRGNDGEVIQGFYPSLIDEATFYKVQESLNVRTIGSRNRKSDQYANLFGRCLVSGKDGSTITLVSKRANARRMVSIKSNQGLSQFDSFPYAIFERFFLSWVKDIDLSESKADDRRDEIAGRLAETRQQIAKVNARMGDGGNFDRLLDLLANLSEQESELKAELEVEESKAAGATPAEAVKDIAAMFKKMDRLKGTELRDFRERLSSRIRSAVKLVKVYTYGGDSTVKRVIVADVFLSDGSRRIFAIRKDRNKEPIFMALIHGDGEGRFEPLDETLIDFDHIGERWIAAKYGDSQEMKDALLGGVFDKIALKIK